MRRVIIVTNPNGRSNGQAFVDFGSSQDAEHAMTLDRQMFGNRYLEVRSPAHMQWLAGQAVALHTSQQAAHLAPEAKLGF